MTITVSNSQAGALKCEAKWMYGFHPGFKLEPRSQSIALTRGSIGHKVLEVFFKGIMDGRDKIDAINSAKKELVDTMGKSAAAGDMRTLDACTALEPVLREYFASQLLTDFLASVQILGVEKTFSIELPGGFILPGQIDLLVRYTRGRFNGEIVPVDNKFVYNHWSEDDFRMNSQMPTYMFALRQMYPNAVIKRGIINQLRHRKNAQDRFALTPITPERGEVDRVIGNHLKQSQRIAELLKYDREEINDHVTRALNKYDCGNCGFKPLCKSELTGGNTRDLIAMEYKPNSYGYGGDEED